MLNTNLLSGLILIVVMPFFSHKTPHLPGELAGRWTVDCGVEYSPEMDANFICSICDDFRAKDHELKQFHMYFVNDSLYFPENYQIKKNVFDYKWNPSSKILKFTYAGLDRTFKVVSAGDSYILVSQSGASVILLLRREQKP